jgi:hypothetical protein
MCLMLTDSLIIEMNVQGDDCTWFEMPYVHILRALLFALHPAHTGTFCNIQQVMCTSVVTTLMTGGLQSDKRGV